MTRSQRFSPVLKIAETKKRNAARIAAEANGKLREYERKLDDLRRFRKEYTFVDLQGGQIMTANQLQERQKFLRQLDEGINVLVSKVEGQKQSTAMDRQVWLAAHKHTDAVDKLLGKMKKIESDLRETRVENELDDRAQYSRPKY